MRKDQQFVQNQLMPFLKGVMTDAKKSGKSFYKYFAVDKRNKETFANSKELYRFKYGANSLFESDKEAEKGFGALIDELFAKMQREFHYGMHAMYLPDENGSFSPRQEEAIFKLSGGLIEKINFKEKQTPEEKVENNEKTVKETNQRFGLARMNVVEPLHLNPETGLIEGKVVNINDPTGSYLAVRIDPVDPGIIYFEDDLGKVTFTLENSDRDISLFQDKDSRSVMNMAGYTDTENGIPQKAESSVGQFKLPEPESAQEKFKIKLPIEQGLEFEIKEEMPGEEGPSSQKEISAGISTTTATAGQGKRPVYVAAGREPVRVTEKGLLELEKQEQERKAGITKQKQPPQTQQNTDQSTPRAEEDEPEEEQDQKKKGGSLAKKIILASVTGGAVIGGGVVGAITTGLI